MKRNTFLGAAFFAVILFVGTANQAEAQDHVYTWPASSLMKTLNLYRLEFQSTIKLDALERVDVLPGIKALGGLIDQARNEPWVEESPNLARHLQDLREKTLLIENEMGSPGLVRDHVRRALVIIDDFDTTLAAAGYQETHRFYYVMFGLRYLKLRLTGLDDARETKPTDILFPAVMLLDFFEQGIQSQANVAEAFADEIAATKQIIARVETATPQPGVFAKLAELADSYESTLANGGARFDRWYPRDLFQLMASDMDRLNASYELLGARKNTFAPLFAEVHQIALDLINDEWSTAVQKQKLRALMTQYDHDVSELPDHDLDDQKYIKEITFYMFNINKIMFDPT